MNGFTSLLFSKSCSYLWSCLYKTKNERKDVVNNRQILYVLWTTFHLNFDDPIVPQNHSKWPSCRTLDTTGPDNVDHCHDYEISKSSTYHGVAPRLKRIKQGNFFCSAILNKKVQKSCRTWTCQQKYSFLLNIFFLFWLHFAENSKLWIFLLRGHPH